MTAPSTFGAQCARSQDTNVVDEMAAEGPGAGPVHFRAAWFSNAELGPADVVSMACAYAEVRLVLGSFLAAVRDETLSTFFYISDLLFIMQSRIDQTAYI